MGGLQMEGQQILVGAQGEQGEHDLMGFVSKPQGVAQVQVHGQPNNIEMVGCNDLLGEKQVIIVGLSKKEWQTIQCKARKLIVNKACKLAIIRKANRQKPFFVSYDPSGKPQLPHRNTWINMLHAYCSCLDLGIDNINAQPPSFDE